jgi:hypothetical protein
MPVSQILDQGAADDIVDNNLRQLHGAETIGFHRGFASLFLFILLLEPDADMRLAMLFFVLLVILLVILFGDPEWRSGIYFGNDRVFVGLSGAEFRDQLLGNLFLFLIMIKNRRAVLRSFVDALPVKLRRVMRLGQEISK